MRAQPCNLCGLGNKGENFTLWQIELFLSKKKNNNEGGNTICRNKHYIISKKKQIRYR